MAYGATFSGPMLSFSNCEIKIAGTRQVGITKIDLEDGLKAENEFGNGPIPLGAPIGQWEGTLSLDQHKQESLALMALLDGLSAGNGFAVVETNMSLTFNTVAVVVNGGTPFSIKRVEIPRVRFLKTKPAYANDGKSVINSWTTLLMAPVGFSFDGTTFVYSLNPNIWSTSNSLSVGLGGTVNISG